MNGDPQDKLWNEANASQKELKRIKHGIKTCEGTMIIDGNDMFDWGWEPMYMVNQNLFELLGIGSLSQYKGKSHKEYYARIKEAIKEIV